MNTQETIIKRKSVRAYKDEQITEEQLNAILNAAYAAPVGGGLYRTMRLTVVQNAALLTEIGDVFKEEGGMKVDMLYGAPTLIIVSGQKEFDNTALFTNAGCILENLQLSATDMALGSVINWATGTVLPDKTELLKRLGIDSTFKPLAGLVIGYPAKEIPKRNLKAVFETNFIK